MMEPRTSDRTATPHKLDAGPSGWTFSSNDINISDHTPSTPNFKFMPYTSRSQQAFNILSSPPSTTPTRLSHESTTPMTAKCVGPVTSPERCQWRARGYEQLPNPKLGGKGRFDMDRWSSEPERSSPVMGLSEKWTGDADVELREDEKKNENILMDPFKLSEKLEAYTATLDSTPASEPATLKFKTSDNSLDSASESYGYAQVPNEQVSNRRGSSPKSVKSKPTSSQSTAASTESPDSEADAPSKGASPTQTIKPKPPSTKTQPRRLFRSTSGSSLSFIPKAARKTVFDVYPPRVSPNDPITTELTRQKSWRAKGYPIAPAQMTENKAEKQDNSLHRFDHEEFPTWSTRSLRTRDDPASITTNSHHPITQATNNTNNSNEHGPTHTTAEPTFATASSIQTLISSLNNIRTTTTPSPPPPSSPQTPTPRQPNTPNPQTPRPGPSTNAARGHTAELSLHTANKLDEALDAHLVEQAKLGREFTPGGQRVWGLVERRGLERFVEGWALGDEVADEGVE